MIGWQFFKNVGYSVIVSIESSIFFFSFSRRSPDHKRTTNSKQKEEPLDSINPRSWKSTANKILEYGNVDVLLLPFWHASLAPALRGVAKRVKKLSPETKL